MISSRLPRISRSDFMIAESAYAVLTRDVPEHGLKAGDAG
jgi:hypothetical protein